jgi:hypothetical protein
MADYFNIRNQSILNPPANTSLGNSTNQYSNVYVQSNLVVANTVFTASTLSAPKITSIGYPGDDTAADPAGGQVITLTGAGFANGASVVINGNAVGVVSFVNSTTITFVSPALSAGSYTIYVVNTDGGTAIAIPGIQYSGTPTWSTAAGSLGSLYETQSFSNTVTATGDAPISYSLFSGTLPTGATLNSNGTITGTSAATANSTTYTFTIRATDNEQQDTDRQFNLTINPDVVTWSSPANASVITSYEYTAISNTTLTATSAAGYGVQYSGSNLPAGISISGNVLSGTSNTVANTTVTLTATANTTNRTSDRTAYINVQQDVVTWNSPANNTTYTSSANTAIANVTLSATSAAGFNVSYSANVLPTGLSITGNVIAGTPTVIANSSSLITATAATTNRTATRTFNWVIQVGGDPYFNLATLLLPGTTTTNTWVTDASTNKFAVTVNGDTRPVGFSPYLINYSTLFTGTTSEGLSLPSSSNLAVGSGDFCLELWFNKTVTGNMGIFSNSASAGGGNAQLELQVYTDNKLLFLGWSTFFLTSTTTIAANTWYHVAICRSGTTMSMFINGTREATTTSSNNFSSTNVFYIGRQAASTSTIFNGVISNLRLVKGSSVYDPSSASLVVPTSPLTAIANTQLLTCQSNRFIDNSTNNFALTVVAGTPKITGFGPFTETDTTTGSGYFDGTGDYIATPSNAAFGFGTGDYTIETWIYPIAGGRIWEFGGNSDNLDMDVTNKLISYYNGGSSVNSANNTLKLYAWNHIACVRISGTVVVYLNGVSVITQASTPNTSTRVLNIAGVSNLLFQGYFSDFRVVKGTGIYNANFTPPTSPLTAVSGTVLLIQQYRQGENNSRFLDTSGNYFPITRNGNTTQGTFSPFSQTGWSNYFDSSYLTVPANTAFVFGTGAFTIEFWIYHTGAWGINNIINNVTAGNQSWSVAVEGGNIVLGGWNTTFLIGGTQPSLNAWHHIAVVRSGTTLSMFIDGVRTGTTTNSTDFSSNNTLSIGGFRYSSTFYYITGYLSNVRLVKGTAVYNPSLTTCTVPTAPLTAISGTSILTCQSNRFVDNSSNAFTLSVGEGTPSVQAFSPFAPSTEYSVTTVGGSMYNSAAGDGLKFLTSTAQYGIAGDFTIELWLYPTAALSAYNPLWILSDSTSTDNPSSALYYNASYNLFWLNNGAGGNGFDVGAGINIVPFQWNHIAITRFGANTRCWTNGVLRISNWGVSSIDANKRFLYVATNRAAGDVASGYTSGFRFINGSAAYSGASNFTPPTAPPTATTNTVSLINFVNFGIYDATSKNDLQTVGNALVSTVQSKWGGTSLYFDGTVDALFQPTNVNYGYGTGDFTIEFWLYLGAVTQQTIVSNLTTSTTTAPHIYYKLNTGIIYYTGVSGTGADRITGSALNTGQWYHIALARASGSTKLFVNGTQTGSTYTDNNNYGTSNPLGVGDYGSPLSGTSTLNGYIDDLRITKGYARYTSNFTAPTSAFPLQ